MLQIENKELFSQISSEESAIVSGGAGPVRGAEAVALFLTANGGERLRADQGVLAAIVTLA